MTDNFLTAQATLESHDVVAKETKKARQIDFISDSFEHVDIFRRVNRGPWKFLATGIKSPFFDKEHIDNSSIDYKIIIKDKVGSSRTEQLIKMGVI